MDDRYVPDCAFVSYARQRVLAYDEGYMQVPPDLAVEVISPGNSEDEIAIKLGNYLAAGTMVILVHPLLQHASVFVAGQAVQRLSIEDEIDGGDVLPGFRLPLRRLFPTPPDEATNDA
jgi:Uma2 family endonuclease